MALSALDDLSHEPDDDQVAGVLGSATADWLELRSWLGESAAVDTWQWGSSGKKYGWGLRAKAGKRTIAYLIPQHGSFLVGLVLGDRALQAVAAVSISAATREVVAGARRYAEGTGFRLPVRTAADLDDIRQLVLIKVRH